MKLCGGLEARNLKMDKKQQHHQLQVLAFLTLSSGAVDRPLFILEATAEALQAEWECKAAAKHEHLVTCELVGNVHLLKSLILPGFDFSTFSSLPCSGSAAVHPRSHRRGAASRVGVQGLRTSLL
jgi:hypothetical protein